LYYYYIIIILLFYYYYDDYDIVVCVCVCVCLCACACVCVCRFRTGDGEVKYARDAEELIRPERNTLLVSFSDLERFNQELATTIQEEYYRYIWIYNV